MSASECTDHPQSIGGCHGGRCSPAPARRSALIAGAEMLHFTNLVDTIGRAVDLAGVVVISAGVVVVTL